MYMCGSWYVCIEVRPPLVGVLSFHLGFLEFSQQAWGARALTCRVTPALLLMFSMLS